MPLPVVDLTPLHTGAPQCGRSTVAESIDAACRDTGCFVVEGHGIDPALRADVFDAAQRLFALPLDDKRQLAVARSSCRRGYRGDEPETFDLARDLDDSHPEVGAGTPLYGPNQWPSIDGFRRTIDAYFAAAFEAAQMVTRGMAIALGLDPAYFTRRMTDSVTSLRLTHHEPTPAGTDAAGCGEHSDEGLLTLIAHDASSGTEVRGRDGSWIDVVPAADQLVVHVGDMMARWSNDRWVAAVHRDHGPVREHRSAVSLFANPDFHCTVQPIVTEGDARDEGRHPTVTVGEHLLASFAAARADR
jgi:isopenicillin N synthase-like dioxygenase